MQPLHYAHYDLLAGLLHCCDVQPRCRRQLHARLRISPQIFWPKLRHDMPEDDSRVPNVIADFIGDNVNDIAGNCSDLLESFVATMAASIMIAVTIFNGAHSVGEGDAERNVSFSRSFWLASACLGCLLGLGYASIRKMGDNPSEGAESCHLDLRWLHRCAGPCRRARSCSASIALYADFRLRLDLSRGSPPCWASSAALPSASSPSTTPAPIINPPATWLRLPPRAKPS